MAPQEVLGGFEHQVLLAIARLDGESRIAEISRMLGAAETDTATAEHVRRMLDRARASRGSRRKTTV